MEVVNHFGPPLIKLKVDEHIIHILNDYADQVLAKDNLKKSLDFTSKLGDAVYGGYSVKAGLLIEVEKFLLKIGTEFYLKFANAPDAKETLNIHSMWVVSQKKEAWSYLHSHIGDISGIIYLKMPSDPGQGLSPSDPRSIFPGGITFAQGTPGEFHRATMTLKPAVGDVLIFPTPLLHTVYPFFGPEERRSFSFNLNIVKSDKI